MNIANIIKSLKWRDCLKSALLLLGILCASFSFAQGWEKTFGGDGEDVGLDIFPTNDLGFIMVGYRNNTQDIYLIKTDADGNEEWSQTYGDVTNINLEVGTAIVQADDDGFVIAGNCLGCGNATLRDIFLMKTDEYGALEWTKLYENEHWNHEVNTLIKTSDGGYLISGYNVEEFEGDKDIYIVKTDAEGNEIWNAIYGDENLQIDEVAYDVVESGNGYVFIGSKKTPFGLDAYLFKTNVFGDSLWSHSYGNIDTDEEGFSIIESYTNDGILEGYAVTGYSQIPDNSGSNVLLLKTSINGALNSMITNLGGPLGDIAYSLVQADDQGYVLTGTTQITGPVQHAFLLKTDDAGTTEWFKTYGEKDPNFTAAAQAIGNELVRLRNGCGYAFTGLKSRGNIFFNTDVFLVKTDCEGTTLSNYIQGNVWDDNLINNCEKDLNENNLANWFIAVEGLNTTYYGTTNFEGNYSILVDTGSYNVSLLTPNANWTSCISSYDINLNTFYDTTSLNFAAYSMYNCPALQVDISTDFIDYCEDENTYTVYYCNNGTALAENATIDVTLDQDIEVLSSSMSYTELEDNTYTFELGNISMGVCDSFIIHVIFDCHDETLEGQTYCAIAQIFPNESCIPTDVTWDNSSISVDATCLQDSVEFRITNVGTEEMTSALTYIIIEDDVMYFTEPQDIPILPADGIDTLKIKVPANGSTWRIIADQSPGHPGNSFPTIAIEGCNAENTTGFSIGYVNQFQEDDDDPYISIDCQESIDLSTFDQSVKRGYPKGYNEDRLIPANTDLKYHILFQNITNDTAIRVVIRDTLSPYLDPGTLELGVASHEYNLVSYGQGILKFTFENIMLPDSSTGGDDSYGFIKFKIAQKPNNPIGTVIHNCAAVTFDTDVPLPTTCTFHEIGGNLWEDFVMTQTNHVFLPEVEINIFPNPFASSITVELNGEVPYNEFRFNIYDVTGRLIRTEIHNSTTFEVERENLSSGLYIYKLESEDRLISTGKIIAR